MVFTIGAAVISLEGLKQQAIEKLYSYGYKFALAAVIFAAGFFIIMMINKAVARLFDKTEWDRGLEMFLENTIKVVLWIILFIVILANLGINVTGLVAGLGIAGIVVGFALQDTLGNLASGVFILFNKPFGVDDFVEAGSVKGTITHIGLAATTMTSYDNKKITMPNSAIWRNPIINYTGLKERMIDIKIGISYSDDVEKAIHILTDILKKDKRILDEPKPVVELMEFGDNSVNLVVRPWIEPKLYWDVHFSLMRSIKKEFAKNNITIPFPQREVWMREEKK